MSHKLIYTENSLRQIKKMDENVQKLLISYMRKIENLEEPRAKGKALSVHLKGFWRFRVEDFRIICEIDDERITIVVIDIGHKKNIYR